MQVEVVKLEGLARRLSVVVPADRLQEAYNARLKEVSKNINLPGFRPGKIPFSVIEKKFGQVVMSDVANELMLAGFQQAVLDNHLTVAGSPRATPLGTIAKDQDLKFEVAFEALPEIHLGDFTQVKIEKMQAEVVEEDINIMLDKLRRQKADWHAVDRAAAAHDRLKIDFDGFIEGKPFPGGSGKDFMLELGSQQMIPGFEAGLLGAKAGDALSLDVVFPQDYLATHLAGKSAVFKIKVHQVQEAHLPELDDAFVAQVGVKGNLEDLRKKLREDMETELKHKLAVRLKDQILDRLIELNPIEVPQSMLEDEIKHLQDVTRQQISSQPGWKGKDPAKIQLPRDTFVPQARKRVILGLLVGEEVKRLSIKSDKNKVREKINEIVLASGYPNPEEMVNFYYQNKRLLSEIETLVLEDQAVEKLLEEAQIVERKVSYQEVFAQETTKG